MLEYHRDDARRGLLWVAHGEVTLAEILELTARQASEGAWSYSMLYDAREREGSLTVDELKQLAQVIAEYGARLGPRGRIATLVPPDAYGKKRMYSLIGERLDEDLEVFHDMREAERWL